MREAIAQVVPGLEQLADIDIAKQEFHVRGRIKHSPEFNTADGKAKLITPNSTATKKEKIRAFTMMTIRSEGQFNSIIYEENDSYRGVNHRWTVLINQQDALELGLVEGDKVELESDFGTMNAVQVKLFNLPRGSIATYYPEANILSSRHCDPRSHTPEFKSIPVSITPKNKNHSH